MKKMKDELLPKATSTRRRVLVLSGMGGIGKTQLATEFCRQHKDQFSSIIWIRGNTRDDVRRSLVRYAELIPKDQIDQRGTPTDTDMEEAVAKDVLAWLAQEGNYDWLLVFDNVDFDEDKPKEVEMGAYNVMEFVPGNHGAVLITTRREDTDHYSDKEIKLSSVDAEMSQLIFNSWYGIQEGSASPLSADSKDTQLLLERLGGLPLAIAQTARYMKNRQVSPAEYIRLWDKRWDYVMGQKRYVKDYPTSVAFAWSISMDQVRQTEPYGESAYELVCTWAFLSHKDLWYGLLSHIGDSPPDQRLDGLALEDWTFKFGWQSLPGWLSKLSQDEEVFSDVMNLLLDYCLVERSFVGETVRVPSYSMHPVVHKWAMSMQGSGVGSFTNALRIFYKPPGWMFAPWEIKSMMVPHADCCRDWLEAENDINLFKASDSPTSVYYCLVLLSDFYFMSKAWKSCIQVIKSTVRLHEAAGTAVGPLPWGFTCDTEGCLGAAYLELDRFDEAEEHVGRAVQATKNTLGDKHVETVAASNPLVDCYFRQKRYEDAKTVLEAQVETLDAIPISERDDVWKMAVSRVLSSIGLLFHHQSDYKGAALWEMRAYEVLKDASGPAPAAMIVSIYRDLVNNLGFMGQEALSTELLETAFLLITTFNGPDDDQARTMALYLCKAKWAEDDIDAAEDLLTRVSDGSGLPAADRCLASMVLLGCSLHLWQRGGDRERSVGLLERSWKICCDLAEEGAFEKMEECHVRPQGRFGLLCTFYDKLAPSDLEQRRAKLGRERRALNLSDDWWLSEDPKRFPGHEVLESYLEY